MVSVAGGNGSSIEDAIVISDCNHSEGINQEYLVLKKRLGTYKLIQQTLLEVEGKMYDKMLVETGGEQLEVFFDITAFFGKGFGL